MRKSTLLKMAMTLTAMFFISGVFAQINLTVKNADGTAANGAIVYTINSSTGAVSADLFTDGAGTDADGVLNGVIQFTPTANTNYIVRNAAGNAWNTFSGIADATVVLRPNFTTVMNDYVSGYNADKITISKPMPFWVYPSSIHNPSWGAPAANYATEAAITQAANLLSTFTWNIGGGVDGSATANDNYVQLTFGTVGVKTVTVQEAAAAAYGGCAGPLKTFYVEAIYPPYAKINETVSVILGLTNVVVSGCEPQNTNIDVLFDNISEEFPYYLVPTITATNYDLNAGGTALINPVAAAVPATLALSYTQHAPLSLAAAGELIAAKDYTVVGNKITVYEINLSEWNAKISRKSDYVTIRDGGLDATDPDNYLYYTAATSLQPVGDVTVVRIIVMPNPVTGPIYHIPNSWGL